MPTVVFKSDLFSVTEDQKTQQRTVEFLSGGGFDLVPARFTLLPSERHLMRSRSRASEDHR
jgi:hypothetical protein